MWMAYAIMRECGPNRNEPRGERVIENWLTRKHDEVGRHKLVKGWLKGGDFRKKSKKSMSKDKLQEGDLQVRDQRVMICFSVD